MKQIEDICKPLHEPLRKFDPSTDQHNFKEYSLKRDPETGKTTYIFHEKKPLDPLKQSLLTEGQNIQLTETLISKIELKNQEIVEGLASEIQ